MNTPRESHDGPSLGKGLRGLGSVSKEMELILGLSHGWNPGSPDSAQGFLPEHKGKTHTVQNSKPKPPK